MLTVESPPNNNSITTYGDKMAKFAMDVLEHGIHHWFEPSDDQENNQESLKRIFDKRMSIIHVVHCAELLLKAFLDKKGYLIFKFKDINKGIKKDSQVDDIINEKSSISLYGAIKLVEKKINIPTFKLEKTDKLRDLRNQIIHDGVNVEDKKKEYIKGCLKELKIVIEQSDFIEKADMLTKIELLITKF